MCFVIQVMLKRRDSALPTTTANQRARHMCTNWIWVHALSFTFSPAQCFVTALANVRMTREAHCVISGHVYVWSLNINVSNKF